MIYKRGSANKISPAFPFYDGEVGEFVISYV